MLTFVLLYIIIITNLGVITPTYVNIYMYIFLHMYSVYQNIYLVDFVESDALIQERNELSSCHFTSWWYEVTSQICSFLSFRGTHHVLLVHLGSFPPGIRWVSRKEAFIQNGCLERTAIRLCKRDTRKCVFFAWIMLTFDFLCSIIVLLRSHPLL